MEPVEDQSNSGGMFSKSGQASLHKFHNLKLKHQFSDDPNKKKSASYQVRQKEFKSFFQDLPKPNFAKIQPLSKIVSREQYYKPISGDNHQNFAVYTPKYNAIQKIDPLIETYEVKDFQEICYLKSQNSRKNFIQKHKKEQDKEQQTKSLSKLDLSYLDQDVSLVQPYKIPGSYNFKEIHMRSGQMWNQPLCDSRFEYVKHPKCYSKVKSFDNNCVNLKFMGSRNVLKGVMHTDSTGLQYSKKYDLVNKRLDVSIPNLDKAAEKIINPLPKPYQLNNHIHYDRDQYYNNSRIFKNTPAIPNFNRMLSNDDLKAVYRTEIQHLSDKSKSNRRINKFSSIANTDLNMSIELNQSKLTIN